MGRLCSLNRKKWIPFWPPTIKSPVPKQRIGNAVFLLKWIKETTRQKAINIFFFYDIACVLHAHLKSTHQEHLLANVLLAIPAFHCYGHKVSCQVNYGGKRLEGFGLSDGEVMERLWSYLRPTAKITKEMTPAHRVDALTDFLMHYAKKSISNIGERLCDHFKKAEETRKETEDQLALLLSKLSETGTKVEASTIEEWTKEEKESIIKETSAEKTGQSGPLRYQEKLKQYYTVRTSLQQCVSGSDSCKILTNQLNRLDEELKKMENGQRRWSPDSTLYLSYLRELEDQRRRNLLLAMHGKCSERWFLLQLMKKCADGQAIANKLCNQITKTTNSMKQLIKQYERGEVASLGCKYPSKVIIQEALDITSSLWNALDDSSLSGAVPYCLKRQIIDLSHLVQRCTEEAGFVKEEMARVVSFNQRKLEILEEWSKQLVGATESTDSVGLLSLVLSKHDELQVFTLHLQELFARQVCGDEEETEVGILADTVSEPENAGVRNEDDYGVDGGDAAAAAADDDDDDDDDYLNDDIVLELQEQDVLDDLRSVLHTEFGYEDDSDTDISDSDSGDT